MLLTDPEQAYNEVQQRLDEPFLTLRVLMREVKVAPTHVDFAEKVHDRILSLNFARRNTELKAAMRRAYEHQYKQ